MSRVNKFMNMTRNSSIASIAEPVPISLLGDDDMFYAPVPVSKPMEDEKPRNSRSAPPRPARDFSYWSERALLLIKGCGGGPSDPKKKRKASYESVFGESFDFDGEFDVVRWKCRGMDSLTSQTKFSRKEIQMLYQGFKQESPSGIVTEDAFKNIFAQYYPGDASKYAHFVFRTFSSAAGGQEGHLNFEQFLVTLSRLSRGTLEEKVQWIFNLYDINGNGYISRSEMTTIVDAIFDLVGYRIYPAVDSNTTKAIVDKLFPLMDSDNDGVVSFEEFSDWCLKDENRCRNLLMFDSAFL